MTILKTYPINTVGNFTILVAPGSVVLQTVDDISGTPCVSVLSNDDFIPSEQNPGVVANFVSYRVDDVIGLDVSNIDFIGTYRTSSKEVIFVFIVGNPGLRPLW